MERINQYEFFDLAKKLHAIDDLNGETPLETAFWAGYQLKLTVDALVQGKPIELGVSRQKAEALQTAINNILDSHFAIEDEEGAKKWKFPDKDTAPVSDWEWSMAKTALSNFEMVFAEEMREAATYRVPSRGIFDTRKLVDAADCTFPPEVLGFVPQKTRDEWKAAGRCLAFGVFTACGFHVARAVEGTLEAYHQFYNGGPDAKLKQWGQYLAALEKIAEGSPSPAPDPKTLGELKQLKDDWRNPLMHPRVVLGEADARAVFNNGETLILLMAQELAAGAERGVQPSLALIANDSMGEGTKAITNG